MPMPAQHPFARFSSSNLWNSIGFQNMDSSWCTCFNPTYQPTTQSVDAATSSSDKAAHHREAATGSSERTAHHREAPRRREEDSLSESSVESASCRKSPGTTQNPSSAQESSGLDLSQQVNSDGDDDDYNSERVSGCFRYLEFEVDVVRESRADLLGMDVQHGMKNVPGLLRILSISPGDAVDRANKKSCSQDPPGPTLEVGDFIVQVNDTMEPIADMVSELAKRSTLFFRIAAVRICPNESCLDLQQEEDQQICADESEEAPMMQTFSYNTYMARKAAEMKDRAASETQIINTPRPIGIGIQANTAHETLTNGALDASLEQLLAKTLPRYSRNDTCGVNSANEAQTNGSFANASLGHDFVKLVSRSGISDLQANAIKETQTHRMFSDTIAEQETLNIFPRVEVQRANIANETQTNSPYPDALLMQQDMQLPVNNGKADVQMGRANEAAQMNGMYSAIPLDKSRVPWDLLSNNTNGPPWRDGAAYLNLLGCMQGFGCLRDLQGRPLCRSRLQQHFNESVSTVSPIGEAPSLIPTRSEPAKAEVAVQAIAQTEVAVQVEDVSDVRLNREVSTSGSEEPTSIIAVACAIACVKEEATTASETPNIEDDPVGGLISMSNVPAASCNSKKHEAHVLSPTDRRAVFSDKRVEEVRNARRLTPPRIIACKDDVGSKNIGRTGRRPSPILIKPVSNVPLKEPAKEQSPGKEAVSVPMVALSNVPTLQWAFEDRCPQTEVRSKSPPPSSANQRPGCSAPRSPTISIRRPSRDGLPRSPPLPSRDSLSPKDARKLAPWFRDQRSEGEFGSFKKSEDEEHIVGTGSSLKILEEADDTEATLDGHDGTLSFSADNFLEVAVETKAMDENLSGDVTTDASPLNSAFVEAFSGKCSLLGGENASAKKATNTIEKRQDELNATVAHQGKAFATLQRNGESAARLGEAPMTSPPSKIGTAAGDLPDALKKAFEKAWDVVHSPVRLPQSCPRPVCPPLPISRVMDKNTPTARTPTPTRSSRSSTPTPRRSLSSKRTNSQEVIFRAEDVVGAEEVQKAMEDAYTEMVGLQQSRHRATSIGSSEILAGSGRSAKSAPPYRREPHEVRELCVPRRSNSDEFSFARPRLPTSSRKSLSKRTQSPETAFRVEDLLDRPTLIDEEEAEYARICDSWSRNRHPSTSSRCKAQDSSQGAPISFSRSASMPATLPSHEKRSQPLLSPRLATGDRYQSAFVVEDIVGEADALAVMDAEFEAILNRWSRKTFRLSSSSSPVESKAQKVFVRSDDVGKKSGEYHSPRKIIRRAKSCPGAMQRADSLGRPIAKNCDYHCSFADEVGPKQPIAEVLEFEASPVSIFPRIQKCPKVINRRTYDSED